MPQRSLDCDHPVTPTGRDALVAIFLSAIEKNLPDGEMAGLAQADHPFRDLIAAAVRMAVALRPLAFSELPSFLMDLTVPLPDLAHACGVSAFETHNATLFTDPPVPPTHGYSLIAFPPRMTGTEVHAQFAGYGLRAAGLRELLCLLRTDPHLSQRPDRLLAYGSCHTTSGTVHPCLVRREGGWGIRSHQEHQRLRSGADWAVAASMRPPA